MNSIDFLKVECWFNFYQVPKQKIFDKLHNLDQLDFSEI